MSNDIGAGASLLGGIVVGDDAVIGANAVVLDDVPADVIGIPAVVVANHGVRPRWSARAVTSRSAGWRSARG